LILLLLNMVIYYFILLDDINSIQELTITSSHIKLLILRSKRKIYAHKFDPMKDKWNIELVYTLCKVLILRKHDASQLLQAQLSFTRTIHSFIRKARFSIFNPFKQNCEISISIRRT